MSDDSGGRSNSTSSLVTDAILIGALTGNNPLTNPLGLPQSGSSSGTQPQQTTYYPGTGPQQQSVRAPRPPLTRAQKIRRTVLTAVGASVFLGYLGYDNNNFLRLIDGVPLIKNLVQPITKPRVAALGDAQGLTFADQDDRYVVVSREACLHEFANPKSKTSVCFDQGHKINGAIVQPGWDSAGQRPSWLAVQVRRDEKILGEPYYLPLRNVKIDPASQAPAVVPAATAADYEVYLKMPAAPKAGTAKSSKLTPGG
jgi:hypothetical protein